MLLTGVPLQKLVLPLHQKLYAAAQRLTHATEQALLRSGISVALLGDRQHCQRADSTVMVLIGCSPEICEQQRDLLCCTPAWAWAGIPQIVDPARDMTLQGFVMPGSSKGTCT